jgi:hypothetical protein
LRERAHESKLCNFEEALESAHHFMHCIFGTAHRACSGAFRKKDSTHLERLQRILGKSSTPHIDLVDVTLMSGGQGWKETDTGHMR